MREITSRSRGRRDKRRKLSWRQCDNMARRSRTNKMRECDGWEGRRSREGEQRDYSSTCRGITVFFFISH